MKQMNWFGRVAVVLASLLVVGFPGGSELANAECETEGLEGCHYSFDDTLVCGPYGAFCLLSALPESDEVESAQCSQGANWNDNQCVSKVADNCPYSLVTSGETCTDYKRISTDDWFRTTTIKTYNVPTGAVSVVCSSYGYTTTYSHTPCTIVVLEECSSGFRKTLTTP